MKWKWKRIAAVATPLLIFALFRAAPKRANAAAAVDSTTLPPFRGIRAVRPHPGDGGAHAKALPMSREAPTKPGMATRRPTPEIGAADNRATVPHLRVDAVIVVRIYAEDKAKWGLFELGQWINYMLHAGIQTIYLYDCHMTANESLRDWVKSYPSVVYQDWGKYNHPYTLQGTQVRAYQDAIDTHGHKCDWQVAVDVDEYPFSPVDFDFGWLLRTINALAQPEITELSMKNFLFLGNDTTSPVEWVIERIVRRTPSPANALDKPIYRPTRVRSQVHHNHLLLGSSKDADPRVLRMNHYWGKRLQNWGNPCQTAACLTDHDIIARTMFDNSAAKLAAQIKSNSHSKKPKPTSRTDNIQRHYGITPN